VTRYYPAYLDLTGRRCVVIGAGAVAERKVRQLLASEADVTLVSPDATGELEQMAAEGAVRWVRRGYAPGDLAGMMLAIAATDDETVNRQVHTEAEREKTLLNVVDVTPLCGFIAPSIVERGPVTLAISTGGASPALARKLRESLSESSELQWADLAGVMAQARQRVREMGTPVPPQHWQCCLTNDLLDLVQTGRETEALESLLSRLLMEHTAESCAGASQHLPSGFRA
jgi:siroheme synthase-like protein